MKPFSQCAEDALMMARSWGILSVPSMLPACKGA
jgi:hypothetical protein